jgi:hypothetical protein
MTRKRIPPVTRPPSPYDADIELLKCTAGKWSDFQLARAVTIVELYQDTDCPEPDNIPTDVSVRQVELWWEYLSEFEQIVFNAPLTGPLGAAAKLRLFRGRIPKLRDGESTLFDSIAGYLAHEGANDFVVPPCPYAEETETLLFNFGRWTDQDLAKAVDLEIEYRAWLRRTTDEVTDDAADEINEHLFLRLDCLANAVRLAPVTGVLGAHAKLRMLLDEDADAVDRVDTAEVLATIFAGLERAVEKTPQVDLKEAA